MPTCPICKHNWKTVRKKPEHNIQFNYSTARFEGINGEMDIWIEKFPAIDVQAEIRRAEAWCYTNTNKKKSDWKRFLGKWFMRAQDYCSKNTVKFQESDAMKTKTAQEELLSALKNQNNKKMPAMSEPAITLFYRIGKRWDQLQRLVLLGEDIFNPQPDYKSAAAGE